MLPRVVEKCMALLLAVLLVFSVLPETVRAEENGSTDVDRSAEYTLDGKTWDELIAEFYDSHRLNKCGYASLGYYNTVTGETHYYDEDRWFIGASIFKLPLGMLYAEMLERGEISLEDKIRGVTLDDLLRGMIVRSSNDYADILWKYRGSYKDMRRDFLPYFNADPETVEQIYWANNYFTARQMLNCLKHLYENAETYAPIIDLMLIASPDRNFKSKEQKYEIAHKYGYVPQNNVNYYNDTAICYTDDPICIVMLTMGVASPSAVLADFCTLACDYAQSSREQRIEREEKDRLDEEARIAEEQRLADEKAAEDKAAEEARQAEEIRLEELKKAEAAQAEAERLAKEMAELRKQRVVIFSLCGVVSLLTCIVLLKRKKR